MTLATLDLAKQAIDKLMGEVQEHPYQELGEHEEEITTIYEFLNALKPDPETWPRFYVDRVRSTRCPGFGPGHVIAEDKGKSGENPGEDPLPSDQRRFLVEFDEEIYMLHDGIFDGYKGRPHHCWWCSIDELQPVPPMEEIE